MTSKEKAIELVDKFENYSFMDIDARISSFDSAKQCALIAVTEIINSNPHSNPFNTDVHSTMQYWIDVKNEIEKL